MTARAMFLRDADHLKSMYTPSVTTGMFLSRKPMSSIPAAKHKWGWERGKLILITIKVCLFFEAFFHVATEKKKNTSSPVAFWTQGVRIRYSANCECWNPNTRGFNNPQPLLKLLDSDNCSESNNATLVLINYLSKKAVERLDFGSTEKVLCYNKWGKKHMMHIF